jgi:hypothetical protein
MSEYIPCVMYDPSFQRMVITQMHMHQSADTNSVISRTVVRLFKVRRFGYKRLRDNGQ